MQRTSRTLLQHRRCPKACAKDCDRGLFCLLPKTHGVFENAETGGYARASITRIPCKLPGVRQKLIDHPHSICNKGLVSGFLRMIIENFLPDGGFYFLWRSIFGILNAYGVENPSR